MLQRHSWAGNVRELENLVRRLAVLYSDDVITAEMVLAEFMRDEGPELVSEQNQKLDVLLETACRRLLDQPNGGNGDTPYQEAISWIEKPLIAEALKRTSGNRVKAAEKLGIHRNTLRTRLKSLKIS